MTGVDTNILVRLLTNDDPTQAQRAVWLFQNEPVFIAKTVLLETEWVLRHAYGLDRNAVNTAFTKLLGLPHVVAEDALAVNKALEWHALGLDFADALHLASNSGTRRFATFDKDLAKQARKTRVHIKVVSV